MNVVSIVSSEEILGQNGFTPCDIFNLIKHVLIGYPPSYSYVPFSEEQLKDMGINLENRSHGILGWICDELKEIINHVDNCKLRRQLERALELCKCLSQTLKTISCIDCAHHLVGKLLCLLVEIILAIIVIIAKVIILLIKCSEGCTSNKVKSHFCDCLICELKKELDDIQELIEKLAEIAIEFVRFASKDCKHDNCKCKDDWKHKDEWECKDDCKHKDEWEYKDDCKHKCDCKNKYGCRYR